MTFSEWLMEELFGFRSMIGQLNEAWTHFASCLLASTVFRLIAQEEQDISSVKYLCRASYIEM
jgi:hypothetical protein